jgi:hypothetical protein
MNKVGYFIARMNILGNAHPTRLTFIRSIAGLTSAFSLPKIDLNLIDDGFVGNAHPTGTTGTTSLKMWVKRSLEILLIVFYSTLSAHIFSLVEPLRDEFDFILPFPNSLNLLIVT